MKAKYNVSDFFMLLHIDDFNNLIEGCRDKLTDIESNRCKYNGVVIFGHQYGDKGMAHPMPMRILEPFNLRGILEEIPRPEPRFSIGGLTMKGPELF